MRARSIGAVLFPIYTDRNINPALKRVCERIVFPNASRYSSHAFRKGAAQELKEKGAQWSTTSTLGEWRSLASRRYGDIATDISRGAPKLLAEEVACVSDADEQVPLRIFPHPYPNPFLEIDGIGRRGFHIAPLENFSFPF